MKQPLAILFLILSYGLYAQIDYSKNWEDFYSYNNVKDFIKVNNIIYAVVDNAVFTYNINTHEVAKMSSVNGLSGETTTSIFYSETYKKLIIGYKNGLIEVVDNLGNITISSDITNFNISGNKTIHHILEYQNKLFLSTSFGIVEYNIENLIFGDTFFIGPASSSLVVNQTVIVQDKIYAATETGVFIADVNNPFLIDFNNWTQNFAGNFTTINTFNNKVFTSKENVLYSLTPSHSLLTEKTFSQPIIATKTNNEYLTLTLLKSSLAYDTNLTLVSEVIADTTSNYYFNLNTSYVEAGFLFLATKEFGILQSSLTNIQNFTEIHPDGPTSNSLFSITAENGNLWVVYGGYNDAYNPFNNRLGFDHVTNNVWTNTPYNTSYPARNLVHVTLDPNNSEKAYISSWHDGMLVVENNTITSFYTPQNSGLESLFLPSFPTYTSTRINGSAFDSYGNLWVTNASVEKMLKKKTPNDTWQEFDISTLLTDNASELNEIVIDKNNTLWIGSRRNGVIIYNELGDRKKALTTEATKGSLPDPNVRAIAVDKSNRIWIGTKKGMVVYRNSSGVFNATIYDAEPIIILDDGIPKKLLGDQVINAIEVDGANNKWFGSDNGGVLYTNPSGRETLAIFNKDNSPLPSNTILKIQVDQSTGKVYFGTDKGIVAYNSNVSAFGETLGEVYAYPNPVRKHHAFVTIDGRNGTHLPKGTNVKILDAAGNLVYETNVVEGQEIKGGKVIWNKTNLAGRKVASGIYIVLLTANENSETSITKIAIIN